MESPSIYRKSEEVTFTGLILSPEVKLRYDGGRSIIFSVNQADSMMEPVFQFLYPHQAMILSLVDGTRDLPGIIEAAAHLLRIDLETASQEVDSLFSLPVNGKDSIRSLIMDASSIDLSTYRTYDPYDFIAPQEYVNMTDIRCKIPCSLIVMPTMRCHTSCIYCYADREGMQGQPEFDLILYKRLVREVKECGIETIDFSGGDLFCRGDAVDIVKSTLSEALYPTIPTKYPLSRKDVNKLAETGLSTIQISIDALSPALIDTMVGRSGYGEKILKTLDYLGKAGIRVRTNSVLTPYNIQDALHLARYLAKMPHVFKSTFTPYGRSLYRHNDGLFCSPTDIGEFERELSTIRHEFPHKMLSLSGVAVDPYHGDEDERTSSFWQRAMCTANQRGAVILPNGKVTICEGLYFHEYFIIGDITQQTLMDVWNSPRALALAHPDQSAVPDGPCSDCSDFVRCHEKLGRCVRDTLKAYGDDKPHWPDPRCPRAPVGNRMV